MASASPVEFDVKLYRGIKTDRFSDLSIGDTIIDKGFMSTSAHEHIAKDFSNYMDFEPEESIIMEFNVPRFTNVIYNDNDDYSHEDEILLLPNSKWNVSEIKTDDDFIKHITLEVANE